VELFDLEDPGRHQGLVVVEDEKWLHEQGVDVAEVGGSGASAPPGQEAQGKERVGILGISDDVHLRCLQGAQRDWAGEKLHAVFWSWD